MQQENLRFRTSPGVFDLLGSSRTHDEGCMFTFSGDLNQMSVQKAFLQDNFFEVGQCGVYPAVKDQETFDRAIKAIWENRVEGWWNYKDKLITLQACTNDEFMAALKVSVETSRGEVR